VHTRNLPFADLEERTRLLYEDGLRRLERLEAARRQQSEQTKAPQRSASAGPSRFEMLYSDANRRDEERKLWQKCHEREELDMCRLKVGARASQCQREAPTEIVALSMKDSEKSRPAVNAVTRNEQSSASTSKLHTAYEAPLPAHSALVLLEDALPVQNGTSGRDPSHIPVVALTRIRNERVSSKQLSDQARQSSQSRTPRGSSPISRTGSERPRCVVASARSQSRTPRATSARSSEKPGQERSSKPTSNFAAEHVPTCSRNVAPAASPIGQSKAGHERFPSKDLQRGASTPPQSRTCRATCTSVNSKTGSTELSSGVPAEAAEAPARKQTPRASPASLASGNRGSARGTTPPPRAKTPPRVDLARAPLAGNAGGATPRAKISQRDGDRTPPKASTPRATPRADKSANTPRSVTPRGITPPRARTPPSARTSHKAQALSRSDPMFVEPRKASRSAALRTGAWPK